MHNRKIAVIGLGYVGLPVAVALGKKSPVIGFDIHPERLQELVKGFDRTKEVTAEDLMISEIHFTQNMEDLKEADFYIVTVPTPVNEANRPDLTPLEKASQTVGKALKPGAIVVYESTVYPGATEEVCVPILERISGLKNGIDFKVGYSPERINPGDKNHVFTKIKKVVSGQDEETLNIIADVYNSVVEAGIFKAKSIKVAEAAKVIENIQRDINIAFINELAILFDQLGIDTLDVLEAAGTKWNFLNFRPGLVGGHCIGVDPYYLTHKAESIGYYPQVILAGRRINNEVGKFIAQSTIKKMIQLGVNISTSVVTVLGLTFKEDCPDLRNSKVIDVINELKSFGIKIQVCDPQAESDKAQEEYGITLIDFDALQPADAVILAVAHQEYTEKPLENYTKIMKKPAILMDIKSRINREEAAALNINLWRL